MNFISAFDELDKLYESVDIDQLKEDIDEEVVEEAEEAATEEASEEAEEEVEEEVVNKPIVLECVKCGALVIKDESEVTIDEESDLANVGEECAYCEESEGFKAIGTFEPYVVETVEDEAPEEDAEAEVIEDEVIEESIFDKKPKYALIYKNRDNTVSAFALGKSKEGLFKKAEELEADWRAKFEDDFDYDFQVVDLKTASQKITDESEIKGLLADKDGFIA